MVALNVKNHVLEVWGDFACFSRPELAVERYSYPCPTPSAARGVFDAIYFKPEFYWQVTRIELLNPPSYIALRRNEVKDKISETMVKRWMKGDASPEPLLADADQSLTGSDQKGRTQRQTMALRQPKYRLHAHIVPKRKGDAAQNSCDSQFVRRAKQGKCFQQPYLGCKEFIGFFRLIKNLENEPAPINYTQDLGFMLYDVFDLTADNHASFLQNPMQVKPSVSMFAAKISSGVLNVPPIGSPEVLRANISSVEID